MSGERLVLGTRGSALALAQAEMTEELLRAAHPDLEIVRKVITTTGDRRTDVPLAQVASSEGHLDKGVFIKELEVALQAGEIDVAVHSLKDVPSDLESGFALAAVLERAPNGDVLVTKESVGLEGLAEGAAVATSSVRRKRMLESKRGDLEVVDIRGNVPTRLRKLVENEEMDGLILAEAGLVRLGLLENGVVRSGETELFAETLDEEWFLPAAGQGAVALEIREGDETAAGWCEAINHAATEVAVTAEREFLVLLGAGCDTPVGVRCAIEGEVLGMWARVFSEEDESVAASVVEGSISEPRELAAQLKANLSQEKS